jgi:2,4-dienoyl-CoA reductase-like NADH-dependent reductase (Old Yellow Enzyme family)
MHFRANSIVFTPASIGPLQVKNRLVRSATSENAATSGGEVSEFLVELYSTLARGGVGLIITGVASVYSKALFMQGSMRADHDSFIPSLAKIPWAVREAGSDCRVMLQLIHPGRQVLTRENTGKVVPLLSPALTSYLRKHPEVMMPPAEPVHEVEPTAPSAVYDPTFDRTPRALTLDEIGEIIESFAEGIRRAQEAGFDGVQLHAAHGYLLSSFLSPRTNRREDLYGGSTENRTRIVREIYQRARKKVDDRFPILIKINTTDFLPGGTDVDEAVRVGKNLSDVGFAAIEASGCMWESCTRTEEELGWPPVLLPESRTRIDTYDQEGYFLPGAKALKENTNAPVILVGGLKTFSKLEEVLNSQWADFVSLCRPLIRQPDLPNRWHSGEAPDKAECVSCNACLPVGSALTACRVKTS